jgi:hypothetical protein
MSSLSSLKLTLLLLYGRTMTCSSTVCVGCWLVMTIVFVTVQTLHDLLSQRNFIPERAEGSVGILS